jgi:hypothetical protein
MKKVLSVLTLVAMLFYMSCSGSKDDGMVTPPPPPPPTCNDVAISYATNLHPIISTKCATNSGCHGEGSVNGPGPLTDYNKVKAAASKIKSAVVSKVMPKTGSLTDAQIQTIKCWAENGTPE